MSSNDRVMFGIRFEVNCPGNATCSNGFSRCTSERKIFDGFG